MEHRQILSLAQPAGPGDGKMDAYALVSEIQILRQRASLLLMKRASRYITMAPDFTPDANVGCDEGRYTEFKQAPSWRPPADEAKFESITVVAPSGF